MRKILIAIAALFAITMQTDACTNCIAAKGATTDGSVFCSYNADDYGMFTKLCHYAAGTHKKGEMREIIDYDTHAPHGFIPEAQVT